MRIEKNPAGKSEKMQQAFQKETVTFKELNWRQKADYIWDYYKWWFLFGFVFLLIGVTTIPAMIENHKEVVLFSVFLNSDIASQEDTSLMEDYIEAKGINIDGKRYTLDTSMRISRSSTDQFSMESSQKMLALFSARRIDVLVADKDNIDFYAKEGAFADLSQVLTADQMKRYKDLLYTTNGTDGASIYGIDVSSSPVLQEEQAFADDVAPVYLSITATTEHVENALAFLDYLMGY